MSGLSNNKSNEKNCTTVELKSDLMIVWLVLEKRFAVAGCDCCFYCLSNSISSESVVWQYMLQAITEIC